MRERSELLAGHKTENATRTRKQSVRWKGRGSHARNEESLNGKGRERDFHTGSVYYWSDGLNFICRHSVHTGSVYYWSDGLNFICRHSVHTGSVYYWSDGLNFICRHSVHTGSVYYSAYGLNFICRYSVHTGSVYYRSDGRFPFIVMCLGLQICLCLTNSPSGPLEESCVPLTISPQSHPATSKAGPS